MADYRHGHNTRKHGRSPTYRSWMAMRVRCKHKPEYEGIDIDPRWDSFVNFLDDMGVRPEGKTLDRVDGKLGYSPDNCRWATHTAQSRNKVSQKGVRWTKRQKAFKADIGVNGKVIHLGYRKDWFEAMCLRKSAENFYWGSV